MKKINVLIADDSATVRKVIGEILDAATGIKVMGAAQDPIFARIEIITKPKVNLKVTIHHHDLCLSFRLGCRNLGVCPRIGAVARGSRFEASFLVI